MADSGRCCNRVLTLRHCGFDIAAKIFDIFHIFLKRSPTIRPYKSLRCLFFSCVRSETPSGIQDELKKNNNTNNIFFFLDKMTVENVAVFLSSVVVGSAGSCWEISPEHFRTTSEENTHRVGEDLLLQHV